MSLLSLSFAANGRRVQFARDTAQAFSRASKAAFFAAPLSISVSEAAGFSSRSHLLSASTRDPSPPIPSSSKSLNASDSRREMDRFTPEASAVGWLLCDPCCLDRLRRLGEEPRLEEEPRLGEEPRLAEEQRLGEEPRLEEEPRRAEYPRLLPCRSAAATSA